MVSRRVRCVGGNHPDVGLHRTTVAARRCYARRMGLDESPSFSVETSEELGAVVVTASGEIDVATAPQVESQLLSLIDDGSSVVLDLAGVTFIDSSGLRTLVTARQRADEQSVSFSLAGRSQAVDRLLQVTGLDTVFENT